MANQETIRSTVKRPRNPNKNKSQRNYSGSEALSNQIKQTLHPQPFDMDPYFYRRMAPTDVPCPYSETWNNFESGGRRFGTRMHMEGLGPDDLTLVDQTGRASIESATTQARSLQEHPLPIKKSKDKQAAKKQKGNSGKLAGAKNVQQNNNSGGGHPNLQQLNSGMQQQMIQQQQQKQTAPSQTSSKQNNHKGNGSSGMSGGGSAPTPVGMQQPQPPPPQLPNMMVGPAQLLVLERMGGMPGGMPSMDHPQFPQAFNQMMNIQNMISMQNQMQQQAVAMGKMGLDPQQLGKVQVQPQQQRGAKQSSKKYKQKSKGRKQVGVNDKQQKVEQQQQQMQGPAGMMMGSVQQHFDNMIPHQFGMPMCHPHNFLGAPESQMMGPGGMLPPHARPFPTQSPLVGQMPPHMLHPAEHPAQVFNPQIMRDSSKPFVFKQKKCDNQIQQMQQQQPLDHESKQKNLNEKQKQQMNGGDHNIFALDEQLRISNYQPLRSSNNTRKNTETEKSIDSKNKKMVPGQLVMQPPEEFMAQQHHLDARLNKIEVKIPQKQSKSQMNKQKKKQLLVNFEQNQAKNNDQNTSQINPNEQQNPLRSNRSKSPRAYSNQNSKSTFNQLKKQNTNNQTAYSVDNEPNSAQTEDFKFPNMLSFPSQQNSTPLRLIQHQSENIFDYRGADDNCYVDAPEIMNNNFFNNHHISIHSPLKSQNSFKSEKGNKHKQRKDEQKALTQEKDNSTPFKFDFTKHVQPSSPFVADHNVLRAQPNGFNQQIVQNSQLIDQSLDRTKSFFNNSRSLSQSVNHPLSANCIRKCTQWQLTLYDQIKNPSINKQQRIKPLILGTNSAVALRQMNYIFEEGLTKEQLNAKKMRIQMPTGPQSFDKDIIDQMMAYEDTLIFHDNRQMFHAKHCPLAPKEKKQQKDDKSLKDGPPEVVGMPFEIKQLEPNEKCCQPMLKNFNCYNQYSYINQPIKLPFEMNQIGSTSMSQQSAGYSQTPTDENNTDLMSQISSQLSERSKTGSQFSQNNGGPSLKSSDTAGHTNRKSNGVYGTTVQQYSQLNLREQMLQILNVQQAENMMCLEFDLQDYHIDLPELEKENADMIEQIQSNRRFRVINQSMIESMIHLRLKASCHGNSLFSPPEMTLNFNIQGKKLIKSIQDRILGLKEKLAQQVRNLMSQEAQQQNVKSYSQKYFLNMVEKNNRHGYGPWLSQTKNSLVVKLLNFNGRSIAFQIAVPDLNNLPNLMTNFNQLVLREFIIEKIFVCFDMPLSKINSIQAQQIDVENYLTATKINSPYQNFNPVAQQQMQQQQWILNSPGTIYANGASNNNTGSSHAKNQPGTSSQGTPIMNLLNVYQEMKADNDGGNENPDDAAQQNQIDSSKQATLNDRNLQNQINSIQPLKRCIDLRGGTSNEQDLLMPQMSNQQFQIPTTGSMTGISTNDLSSQASLNVDQNGKAHYSGQMPPNVVGFQNRNGQVNGKQIPQLIGHPFEMMAYQQQAINANQMGMMPIAPTGQRNQPFTTINNYFGSNEKQKLNNQSQQEVWFQQQYQMIHNHNSFAFGHSGMPDEIYFGGRGQPPQMQKYLSTQPQNVNGLVGQVPQADENQKNMEPNILTTSLIPSAIQQEVQPGLYTIQNFLKEDRAQMCNLDRFIEATMPKNFNSAQNSFADLVEAYHKVSVNGIQIDFQDDRSEDLLHVFTFTPTLSSLYLLTNSGTDGPDGQRRDKSQSLPDKRKQKMVEFHEEQPHYKRKLLSHTLVEQAKDIIVRLEKLDLTSIDVSSSSSSYGSSMHRSLGDSSSDVLSQKRKKPADSQKLVRSVAPHDTITKSLSTEFSWFSIMWTCQKKQTLKKDSTQDDGPTHPQNQSSATNDLSSGVQFLVFYKFGADSSGLEIIGMLTSKLEREGFWLTPSQLCENEIQGQIFDEIYDSNIIRLQDMQEKCIKFMKDQGNMESSFDFMQMLRGQQIEPQSRDKQMDGGDKLRLNFGNNQMDISLHQMLQKMSSSVHSVGDAQPLYNNHHQQNGPRQGAVRSFLLGGDHRNIHNIPFL